MKNSQTKLMPLNIQFFAESGEGNGAAATGTPSTNATNVQSQANVNTNVNNSNVNYDDIFKKLDSILDKRSDGIAKSALKDNGLEDDDIKDVLSKYKASKQAKTQEVDTTISTLKSENETLKASIQKERMNNEALKVASSLGVDDKTVPYLIKLADLSKCLDDKGNVSADKIKAALSQVLTDVPSLKQTAQGRAGVKVGADTSNQSNPSGNMFGFNFTGVRKTN